MANTIALQFPGGTTLVRKPTKAELTVTARSWLKLAIATAAHVERDLKAEQAIAAVVDFQAMKHAVEMALSALEEAR